MRSNFPFIVAITLPFGAGPGQQRQFFGPASGFPPALITYLRGNGWDPVGGIIAYGQHIGAAGQDDNYAFLVQGVAFPGEQPSGWILGNFTTGVFETQLLTNGGIVYISPFGESIQLSIGSGAGPGSVTLAHGKLSTDGGQIIVNSAGPGIDVQSGGSIAIESGGQVVVSSGGQFTLSPGSSSDFEGTTEFHDGGTTSIDWHNEWRIDPNGNRGYTSTRRDLIVNKIFTGSVVTPTGGAANFVSWPTATFRNGRAFRMVVAGTWSASAVGVQALYWLNNGVGANIAGEGRTVELVTAANQTNIGDVEMIFVNTSGADVSTGMQFQVIAPAGATVGINGAGRLPIWGYIEDYGAAADWSGVGSL